MCFFLSFVPATILVTLGYFVLFSTTKTDGSVRRFGQFLSLWIFLLALLPPILGAYVTLNGLCPITRVLQNLG